jgi:hypothetical protein
MEAADKRPDAPVVILAGPVVLLVSRMPIGIVAQNIRKQTRRRIHGQISAVPHGLALGLDPCHHVSCPIGRRNPSQNRQAVAQQVKAVSGVNYFSALTTIISPGQRQLRFSS